MGGGGHCSQNAPPLVKLGACMDTKATSAFGISYLKLNIILFLIVAIKGQTNILIETVCGQEAI
jgi:hypothetical protein